MRQDQMVMADRVDLHVPGAPAPVGRRLDMEKVRLRLYLLCAGLEVLAVATGFLSANAVRDARWLAPSGVPLLIVAAPLYVAFALVREAYTAAALVRLSESIRRALEALLATAVAIITFAFFTQLGEDLSRVAFFSAIMVSGTLIIGARALIAAIVRIFCAGEVVRTLLIVERAGGEVHADGDVLDLPSTGLRPDLSDPVQMARISRIVSNYDRVFLRYTQPDVSQWVTALKATGVSCELLIAPADIHGAVALGSYGESDTLVLSRGQLSLGSRLQKRALDLALTVPLLVFLAPLLLLVALAVRLDSPGPALFKQIRIGRGNQPFTVYKFRSMHADRSDQHGARSTGRSDDRITRVGRFIRRTSIDELPQILNVLIGDMSLVGPRPHAPGSTAGDRLFWEVSDRYWMRHALKPGITGLAQVRGFRGATERSEDLEARLRSDLEYLQEWSLWRDVTILFATLGVVSHKNAF